MRFRTGPERAHRASPRGPRFDAPRGSPGCAGPCATRSSPAIPAARSSSDRHVSSVSSRVATWKAASAYRRAAPSRRAISCVASRSAEPALARNSSTSRRWRSSDIVSPTTRPAAARARSVTSDRSSPIARCFSASMSAAARSRMRSSSSRVAVMSASRVSCATFWARARMSLASRRASDSVATRSASADSRSRRACSASLRPCSMRDWRSASMPVTGLSANVQMSTRKTRKLIALTITQNRLTWNSAASPSADSWTM